MNQSSFKISEGYGYSGEMVTEIYLSGFEQIELDQMDENLDFKSSVSHRLKGYWKSLCYFRYSIKFDSQNIVYQIFKIL